MKVDRNWLFLELQRMLRLLAADGEIALAGVPEGSCKPDELALDYENFQESVVGNFSHELPEDLIAALQGISEAFAKLGHEAWTEEAVLSSSEWAGIRNQAKDANRLLERFECSN